MNENKSREPRYNKRKRLDADKLHVSERNINTSGSIKVTIMNNLNIKQIPENVGQKECEKPISGDESDSFLLKIIFSNNIKYSELKTNVFKAIKRGLNSSKLTMKEFDDKNFIEIYENDDDQDHDQNMETGSDLFTIDTEPEKASKKSKEIEIPVYTKDKFTNVLLMDKAADKKDGASKRKAGGKNCFNCGENHNLKDCHKPRNHVKIQQRMTNMKGGDRYHIELNQKYASVIPGVLSKELRDALGLRKHEIPSHVYRMRIFGYPPGWLEDHKVCNSGLTLFDSQGKTVVGDSDEEQGEIIEKVQYDLDKIIDFPGFNVPPTKSNQFDDFNRNRVPPRSESHSKQIMIECLSDKLVTPYKHKKKLLNFPGENIKPSDDNNVEEHSMEIEDDDEFCGPMLPQEMPPPIPRDPPSSKPPPPPPLRPALPPSDQAVDSDESGEIVSDDENDTSNSQEPPPPGVTEALEERPVEPNKISCETNAKNLPDENEINLCTTKFETNGTPLLQFSPYTSLPSGEKFSVGVSDVINFENLPDSTGKYETMKEILKRVRNEMDKLHEGV